MWTVDISEGIRVSKGESKNGGAAIELVVKEKL